MSRQIVTLAALIALAFSPSGEAQGPVLKTSSPLLGEGLQVYYGDAVAGLANVAGDGRGDVLIGTPYQLISSSWIGRAYLRDGTTGALMQTYASPNPHHLGYFGTTVDSVPDVSGDNSDDILIGAPGEPDGQGGIGRVYLYQRPSTSGQPVTLLHSLVSPNTQGGGSFGQSVAGIPDVDGDGFGDILIGAPREDVSQVNSGRAYVFSGATGLLLRTLVSPNPNQFVEGLFGQTVSGVPDLNGDGIGDLVVGEYGWARAHVFSGATGALLYTLLSPPFSTAFSVDIAGIPDINGDGRGDILIGASQGGTDGGGVVFVYSGFGLLVTTLTSPNSHPPVGFDPGGGFGVSVAAAGDTDGDGISDILVGAYAEPNDGVAGGRAYVFSGATLSLLSEISSPKPSGTTVVPKTGFGWSVAGLPDADGDGSPEYIVGSPFEHLGGAGSGAVYAYFCTSEVEASATVRLGTPPNPLAFTSSDTPIIGSAWVAQVDDASLIAGATLNFVLISASTSNIPSGSGTLLVGASPPPLVLTNVPGSPFNFQLPPLCVLVGIHASLQAGSSNGVAHRFSNALDLTLGTY